MDVVAFLLWLELLDGVQHFLTIRRCWADRVSRWVPFDGFVDPAICTAADEAYDVVLLVDFDLSGVSVA